MPERPRGTATSYDEIQRRTVPEPDLSFQPTRDERDLGRHRLGEATEHGQHALTREERELLDRVRAAVSADTTLELGAVELEIDGHTIVLKGSVPGPSTKVRIEDLAGAVAGVEQVDNQLVVGSPGA